MISVIRLFTVSSGVFYAHLFRGKTRRLFVCIPGFGESKAGLFYLWSQMARRLQKAGNSALLFDLAGQGDSLLPLSLDIWKEQIEAIKNKFREYQIHFIARGLGAILLPSDGNHAAIMPSRYEPVAKLLKQIRWAAFKKNGDFVTPAFPHKLSDAERDCFHYLGAEAECIGGLLAPSAFLKTLAYHLPLEFGNNIRCYTSEKGHPLFDKQSERDTLIEAVLKDFSCTGKLSD